MESCIFDSKWLMSPYSHDSNSFKLSFIPNAAINKATQPITPTIAMNALNLLDFASLMFHLKLKLKRFQSLDLSIKLFEEMLGGFGLIVLAGFSFEILLHARYVTKTDKTTNNIAIYTKLMSKPGAQVGML